eukprot:TRINITY_DN68128_c7_g11_i1.p2 TRINITY_DN68128_c7_g11~~TRINITY_DN68128_c7_g11_i1.p2  ORF type:complete len:334 (-),score=33.93 TRINITY_DN68128_c7_g11_i1:1110-2087(-)
MEADGFTLVRGNSKHKQRPDTISVEPENYSKKQQQRIRQRLCRCEQELKSSGLLVWVLDWITERLQQADVSPKTVPVHCVGVGSPLSANSCWQLALIKIIYQQLHFQQGVLIHEPILCSSDIEVITDYCHDATVLTKNLESRISCSIPTFVYMPHCPCSLYNNLLLHNWNAHNLNNIFLIGNKLSNYSKHNCMYEDKRIEAVTILTEFVGIVEKESPLLTNNNKNDEHSTGTAFTDMCCTHFETEKVDKAVWEKLPKPPTTLYHQPDGAGPVCSPKGAPSAKFKYKEARPARRRGKKSSSHHTSGDPHKVVHGGNPQQISSEVPK